MKKKILSLLLAFALLLSPTVFAARDESAEVTYFDLVKDFVEKNYKFGVTDTEIYENALKEILRQHPDLLDMALTGMAKSMDEHTRYLMPADFKSWMESIQGTFVGIGVTIEERNGYITVVNPVEGSPAEQAGLIAGDRFYSVDDVEVVNQSLEYVRSLVVGEQGTTVKIGVLREGEEEPLYFEITRAPVEQRTVNGYIEGDVGYIYMSSFALNTYEEMKQLLADFDAQGIKKLILDLRNNPGGEKTALVDTVSLFAPKGPVLNIEYADSAKNEVYRSNNPNPGKYKIVALVNGNSASAAEAFTGTLKDTKAATIVGEVTYGKGTVQTLQPLATGGAMKLTIATYTTANGTEINGVGVTPDYIVRNERVAYEDNPDAYPFEFAAEINEHSSEDAIKAIGQRFALLSIYAGDTISGVFDDRTVEAIKVFQKTYGMEVTGVMDIMTQVEMNNLTREIKTVIDHQLNKAFELLK